MQTHIKSMVHSPEKKKKAIKDTASESYQCWANQKKTSKDPL